MMIDKKNFNISIITKTKSDNKIDIKLKRPNKYIDLVL